MPLPSEETTPPVTKTNLVMAEPVPEIRILPEPSPRDQANQVHAHAGIAAITTATGSAPFVRASHRVRPARAPRRSPASRGFRQPVREAASSPAPASGHVAQRRALIAAPMRFARPVERRELRLQARSSAARLRSSICSLSDRAIQRGRLDRSSAPPPPCRPASANGRAAAPRSSLATAARPPCRCRPRRETASGVRASSSGPSRFRCSWLSHFSFSGSKRPATTTVP